MITMVMRARASPGKKKRTAKTKPWNPKDYVKHEVNLAIKLSWSCICPAPGVLPTEFVMLTSSELELKIISNRKFNVFANHAINQSLEPCCPKLHQLVHTHIGDG